MLVLEGISILICGSSLSLTRHRARSLSGTCVIPRQQQAVSVRVLRDRVQRVRVEWVMETGKWKGRDESPSLVSAVVSRETKQKENTQDMWGNAMIGTCARRRVLTSEHVRALRIGSAAESEIEKTGTQILR